MGTCSAHNRLTGTHPSGQVTPGCFQWWQITQAAHQCWNPLWIECPSFERARLAGCEQEYFVSAASKLDCQSHRPSGYPTQLQAVRQQNEHAKGHVLSYRHVGFGLNNMLSNADGLPMQRGQPASHVFCLGLLETGVEALTEALLALNKPICIDPAPLLMSAGRFPEALAGYEGAAGSFVACMFRELDQAYPESKFILTVRTPHDWLDTMERKASRGELEHACERMYGSNEFHRDAMAATYELHKAAVLAHFVGREDDLLLMDLYRGDGWEVLCEFLGQRPPRRSFPRVDHHIPIVHVPRLAA